ncbi:MAG TPA: hypothetical protein VLZ84_10185, partial [Asticcacaulis sp.]|nr:hypothetical protein [Asticcacaulis sp.]
FGFFLFWGVVSGIFSAARMAWIAFVGRRQDHKWAWPDVFPHRAALVISAVTFSVAILIGPHTP